MLRTLTGALLAAAIAAPAFAADYGDEAAPYTPPPARHGLAHGVPPLCDEPDVISRVAGKFAHYDANVIYSGLVIEHIDGIHQTALRAGGPSLVDRRYCGGTVWLSDGRRSEVVYLIEGRKLGAFSIGWSVESCLPGFDPYRVYDGACRSIRP
jgi:hypothetical protein